MDAQKSFRQEFLEGVILKAQEQNVSQNQLSFLKKELQAEIESNSKDDYLKTIRKEITKMILTMAEDKKLTEQSLTEQLDFLFKEYQKEIDHNAKVKEAQDDLIKSLKELYSISESNFELLEKKADTLQEINTLLKKSLKDKK